MAETMQKLQLGNPLMCSVRKPQSLAGAGDSLAGFHLYPPNNSQVKRRAIEQTRLQIGYILLKSLDVKKACIAANLMGIGAAYRIRTDDLPLTRRLLYQLS
jgi:hypothetical protein